jgi:hypothetical protein
MMASLPAREVERTRGLMREMRELPLEIETPAEAYVRGLASAWRDLKALEVLC